MPGHDSQNQNFSDYFVDRRELVNVTSDFKHTGIRMHVYLYWNW